MLEKSKVHILALLQKQEPEMFLEIKAAYASQYSRNAAQYMSSTLDDWSRGATQITPENLERIERFHFPDFQWDEKDRLVSMLYTQFRKEYPIREWITIVIDVNEKDQIQRLKNLVEYFKSDDFERELSYPGHGCGIGWVCGDDPEIVQSLLRKHTRPQGARIFDTIDIPVDLFLRRFMKGEFSAPYCESFEFEGGSVEVSIRHKYFKGLRDATHNTIQTLRRPLNAIGQLWNKLSKRRK